MGLRKGQTNNKNGRPKGKPNDITAKVRETFSSLLELNMDKLQSDIDSLSPKDRIRVFLDLAEFIVPKLNRVESVNLNKDLDDVVHIYLPHNFRDNPPTQVDNYNNQI